MRIHVLIALLLAAVTVRAQTPDDLKTLSHEIVNRSGLHFQDGDSDLLSRLDAQAMGTKCESFEIQWSAERDKEMVPALDAQQHPARQKFSLLSRAPADNCGTSIPPFELPAVQIIVFGTDGKGTIRGLRLIPHMRDPRLVIVECPELFGGKSSPGTRCGEFLQSRVTLSLLMPSDPQIRHLEFFERVLTSHTEWRLERLGTLNLAR